MSEPVLDLPTWKANHGKTAMYFASVPDALEFCKGLAEGLRECLVPGGPPVPPEALIVPLGRIAALLGECARLHREWEAVHPPDPTA